MAVDQSRPPDRGPTLTRRRLLKTGAGAAAGGALLSGADAGPLDLDAISPTREADALLGEIVTAPVVGAAWALKEIGVMGSDAPPDGLGPDTLQTQIYQAAKKRKSVNQSTFMDNKNIIQYIPEAAFSDGKLAALEAIQDGATESEAINAGQQAVNQQFATIEENYFNSWNETLRELESFNQAVLDHTDLTLGDVITIDSGGSPEPVIESFSTYPITLSDGTSKDVVRAAWITGTDQTFYIFPFETAEVDFFVGLQRIAIQQPSGDELDYIFHSPNDPGQGWTEIWHQIQDTRTQVNNNIATWVNNVYDQIQAGEISPSEYMSGTDFANTIAADEENAQAIGDLLAMNVPGDYDQEATVKLLDDGATVKGFVATTDTTNVSSISTGDQFDPAATDSDGNALYETFYLAYRPGSYIETWGDYSDSYGIQGGTLRFTSDPSQTSSGLSIGDSIQYAIETTAGETATAFPSAFTEETIDGTTYWTTDVTGQLDEAITDIDRVRVVYAGDSPDTYQTMILDQPFKIEEIEGDTSSLSIQQNREPQTDSNYITDEEWQQLLEQQQELMKRFEEAKAAAGGGGGDALLDNLPRIGLLPGWVPGGKFGEYVVLALLGLFGFNVATS